MIVKLKKNNGWVVYDNVVQINHSLYNVPVCLDSESQDYVHETFDYALQEKPDVYTFVVLNRKDGSTLKILTCGSVFVLNDDGKTIDKF